MISLDSLDLREQELIKMQSLVKDAARVLILCHDRMDGDAMCSVVFLCLWLESLDIFCQFAYFNEYPDSIPLANSDFPLGKYITADANPAHFDIAFVVDSSTDMLGPAEKLLQKMCDLRKPVIVIDHHITNKGFGAIDIILPDVSATCELLYLIAVKLNIPITPEMAHCLLWGIFEDTHFLRTSQTSSQTLRVTAELIDAGGDRVRLHESLPLVASYGVVKEWGEMLCETHTAPDCPNFVYTLIDETDLLNTPGLEPGRFASFMRDVGGIDVAAVMTRQKDGSLRVSLRSKKKVHVGNIAVDISPTAGGGHRNASGCTISGMSHEEATRRVINVVISHLKADGPDT